jgi:hypothetical protein
MRPLLNSGTLGGREVELSPADSGEIAEVLRAVLGGDHRYRKFVRQLAAPRPDGLLHFWQSAILDTLEAKRGLVLPRRADELRALLPPLPEPPRLEASAVPTWLSIDEIVGSAPVQASGRAGDWRWYFRARHNSWSLGAVFGSAGAPIDVDADSSNTFYAEDEYGDLPEDASYMDLDEVRFLIVRELTRLRDSRGLKNLSQDR